MRFDLKKFFGKKSEPKLQEGYDGLLKERPAEIIDVKEPTGASIKREYIYIFVGIMVILFVLSFLFGIYNTKKTTAPEDINMDNTAVKGAHLNNVPSKYSDPNAKKQEKPLASPPPQLPPQPKEIEYQPPRQQYQRIPSPPQPVVKSEMPKTQLDPAMQLRLQQAKEKEAANKSPIQFSVDSGAK